MEQNKTWLVTGASKGLGFELVHKLLLTGHNVIATSRTVEKLQTLQAEFPNSLLPLSMEVIDEESVKASIEQAINHFGRIDVVVNNAGYGLLGTLEELSMSEIKNCFDVNVFGVINVSKAILPFFRTQKSGLIINIASVSGSVSGISTGIYSATKSAVLQLSEALASEVQELGIRVIAICPGGFRTDFLDKSSMKTPSSIIQDYQLVHQVMNNYGQLNKNQGGDPKKAADIFLKLADMPQIPSRLYLGTDALRMMQRKLNQTVNDIQTYQELTSYTDIN